MDLSSAPMPELDFSAPRSNTQSALCRHVSVTRNLIRHRRKELNMSWRRLALRLRELGGKGGEALSEILAQEEELEKAARALSIKHELMRKYQSAVSKKLRE